MSILILFFIIFSGIFVALLEIQIEGPSGWAKNLPCWRPRQDKWYVKVFKIFFGGKELTGYHLAFWAMTIFFFHAPFFWGIVWTASLEANILASFLLFWIIEDFLWFIFNPDFGISRFRAKYIPWHKNWWGPLPKDYYIGIAIVTILLVI